MPKKIILILLAVLVGAGIVVFAVLRRPARPAPVYFIVGEITALNNNGFSVRALAGRNSFGEDNAFSVLVASSTAFSGIEIPRTISQKDAGKPVPAEKAGFSDLGVGDNVAVESFVNLRNVRQFTAKSVQSLKTVGQ